MHLNFTTDNHVKVEAIQDPKVKRSVHVTETKRLKLGSVCGVDKEYPVAVNYYTDSVTNKLIIVSTSNYGTRYKSLIGRLFDSLEQMEKTCLRIYTPPYRD